MGLTFDLLATKFSVFLLLLFTQLFFLRLLMRQMNVYQIVSLKPSLLKQSLEGQIGRLPRDEISSKCPEATALGEFREI